MLTAEEKAACLRQGIFAGLDEGLLQSVGSRMGERDCADGEELFLLGEPGDEIFVIVEGAVEIFIGSQIIAVLGRGQLFGEMAVLGGGRRTAGGRARGATKLLFLKDKALRILIQQTPEFAFALFRVLIRRLEEANRLSLFLSGEKKTVAVAEGVDGDIAGKTVGLYHAQAPVGRSMGSVTADALRLALPTADKNVLERHGFVRVDRDQISVAPLEGAVEVNGERIEDAVVVDADDVIRLGGVAFRIRSA